MTESRKRLLVLTSTYPRSCTDTTPAFVHQLCQQLAATYDVTVIAPHSPGSKRAESMNGVTVKRFLYCLPRYETLAYDGGIIANLKKRRWRWGLLPLYLLSLTNAVNRELRKQDFDAIHAHWILPQGPAAIIGRFLARKRPPILVTSHGADLFALSKGPMNWIKRWVLGSTDAATFVSRPMLDRARQMLPSLRNAQVIPMGVDLEDTFVPGSALREANSLLFVGRLVEKKGVTVLLEALAQVRKEFRKVHLRIAGDGPDRQLLVQLSHSLGIQDNVTFLGAVSHDRLPGLYQRAAIFVMPSLQAQSGDEEGFGLVLVEALGCGTPAIASDYRAVRDIVTDDVVTLVPTKDSRALADAIRQLLRDEVRRVQLGSAGRRHVRGRFDWAIIGDRYARLIGELIDQAHSGVRRND